MTDSIYATARAVAAIYRAGRKLAACRCCWLPPWGDGGVGWDDDEVLAKIGWMS